MIVSEPAKMRLPVAVPEAWERFAANVFLADITRLATGRRGPSQTLGYQGIF
jgi:hypothetical protein